MSGCDLSFSEERVQGLINRINEYESYFRHVDKGDGEKLDHQGTTAYINLVKLVVSMRQESATPDAKDPAEIRRIAQRIMREEYGVSE